MIDLYCERVGDGFWEEPFNALTNLAFIVAAVFAWREAKARKVPTPDILSLIALVATIGVGSFLFHTLATPWALAADLIPILLFQMLYLWVFITRTMRLRAAYRVLAVIGLLAAVAGLAPWQAVANGSLTYLPAVFILLALGKVYSDRAPGGYPLLWVAAVILVASITLRSVDLVVCEHLAIGTHFLWHLLNAVVLYLVIKGLLQVTTEAEPRSEGTRAMVE